MLLFALFMVVVVVDFATSSIERNSKIETTKSRVARPWRLRNRSIRSLALRCSGSFVSLSLSLFRCIRLFLKVSNATTTTTETKMKFAFKFVASVQSESQAANKKLEFQIFKNFYFVHLHFQFDTFLN